MSQPKINVENVVDTLSKRIAQLEVDKAILIEQVKYFQEQAEGSGELSE